MSPVVWTRILCAILLVLAPGLLQAQEQPSSKEVLRMLTEGNARFVVNEQDFPNQTRLFRYAEGRKTDQQPKAIILANTDARVPVEMIYDQGIGDLYVIRAAGVTISDAVTGAIEYALERSSPPVILVLGNSNCSLINSAIEEKPVPPKAQKIIQTLRIPISQAIEENPKGNPREIRRASTQKNVMHAIETLFKESKLIRKKVFEGETVLVGSLYNVETGVAEWLGPHPQQEIFIRGEGAAKPIDNLLGN